MREDNNLMRMFTRRTALLAGGQIAMFSALVGRMYYLQVVESEKYKVLAEDNRINLRLLPPPRGRILDRYGDQIAINQLNYRVVLVPEQTGSVPMALDAISEIVPINEFERRRILREVARKRKFLPVTVKENLSWDEVSRVAVNAPELPGVMIDVGQSRHYPSGELVAHVIGYVAAPSEADQQSGDPLLELPDFRVGRNGVERVYDLALRGRAGSSQIEVNALGRPIRELARKEGEPGHELVMTLDLKLQNFAAQRLGQHESSAAVLMDVHSGEVLCLASSPGFDPNEFNKGISGPLWRELLGNTRAPLTNKSISGLYAPGSTYKPMVALAALEFGISPDMRVNCPGHMSLGDSKFHCWKKGGHGGMDMVEAIKQSCDVYFYEVARRMGVDRFSEMSRRFGLGTTTGIDCPGERSGLMPTRAWKLGATGVAWQAGENLVAGIGQGFVLTTPLQLAVMTARLVNGGFAVKPRLTRDLVEGTKVEPRPTPSWPSVGVSQQNLAIVMRAMRAVMNDPRGTAFRARVTDPTMLIGGKSGTSQVRRITEEERRVGLRKPEQVPWKERDNALFIAYGPVDNPKYACAVIVEHGGGGSSVAAPIARDLLVEAMKRDRESPPLAQRYAAASSPQRENN